MKFFDEEKLCWADIMFWGFVGAIILIGGYGVVAWVFGSFAY